MPTLEHDGLVDLFRRDPHLAADLLRHAGVALPRYDRLAFEPTEVGHVVPAYRSDLVLLFASSDRAVLALVLEVQRRPDADKTFLWPLYASAAAARHRCPAAVLVYAANDAVADWAERGLVFYGLDGKPSSSRPLVLRPRAVPRITPPEALARPYLATLSAMAHANEPDGLPLVALALRALDELDGEDGLLLRDTLLTVLDDAARHALKEMLDMQNFVPKSQLMKEWQAEAIAKGLAEGTAKGLAEGTARGTIGGLARALLLVLEARGLFVSDAVRSRIAATAEAGLLERWTVRAATVETAEAIFEET